MSTATEDQRPARHGRRCDPAGVRYRQRHGSAGLFGSRRARAGRPTRFDRSTTLAILAGFAHNRRVIISGYHGTRSRRVEQVAARLNWPCVRVNLDSHISRIDLISGRDHPRGPASHRFRDGICRGLSTQRRALLRRIRRRPPDVMFVIQRVLESSGRLTCSTRAG
jgi:MoxR-like ATPase